MSIDQRSSRSRVRVYICPASPIFADNNDRRAADLDQRYIDPSPATQQLDICRKKPSHSDNACSEGEVSNSRIYGSQSETHQTCNGGRHPSKYLWPEPGITSHFPLSSQRFGKTAAYGKDRLPPQRPANRSRLVMVRTIPMPRDKSSH